jgi:hypothetical protein
VVKAVDAGGNISTQTLTVTVTNADDTAPAIAGPSGAAGAATSTKSVAENTTPVHTFTANEPVTWSVDGGADAARFTINPTTGALTFVAPPNFEIPTDADENNVYLVVVKAVDAGGNISTQTLTVTVTNADEFTPRIQGPTGAEGDASSTASIPEGTTAVHTYSANEDVTWSLDGGADAAAFSINPLTGVLAFTSAKNFERPTDADANNTYVVVIKATDPSGNVSTQTLTVTITDVNEAAKLVITGTGSMVAGSFQTITITAYTAQGDVERAYAGVKSLTFSGASLAPDGTTPTVAAEDFGAATSLTFANGTADASMYLYAAETAIIATTDGTLSAAGTDRLTVVVSADDASPVVSGLTASPSSIVADGAARSTLSLRLKDPYGNVTANVASPGTVTLVQSAGTGTLLGSLTNVGGGLYTQEVEAPAAVGTGTFNASINGTLTTSEAVVTYVAAGGALSRVVCTESQAAGQNAASTVTVNLCAATQPGDLELVTLGLDLTTSNIDDISAPVSSLDGTWVKILSEVQGVRGGGNKPMLFVVYARRYETGLRRTATFSGGTQHKWSVDMVTFESSGSGTPSGTDIQTAKNETGSGLASPGLTAGEDNTIVLYVMANSLTGNVVTATDDLTLVSLANNNTGGTSSTSFIELLANGATAPSRTWTSSRSANTVLMQLLVRP